MEKKLMEIGLSTGLVLLMALMMLVVRLALPEGIRATGFALVVLIFMILMGLAGFKLQERA